MEDIKETTYRGWSALSSFMATAATKVVDLATGTGEEEAPAAAFGIRKVCGSQTLCSPAATLCCPRRLDEVARARVQDAIVAGGASRPEIAAAHLGGEPVAAPAGPPSTSSARPPRSGSMSSSGKVRCACATAGRVFTNTGGANGYSPLPDAAPKSSPVVERVKSPVAAPVAKPVAAAAAPAPSVSSPKRTLAQRHTHKPAQVTVSDDFDDEPAARSPQAGRTPSPTVPRAVPARTPTPTGVAGAKPAAAAAVARPAASSTKAAAVPAAAAAKPAAAAPAAKAASELDDWEALLNGK